MKKLLIFIIIGGTILLLGRFVSAATLGELNAELTILEEKAKALEAEIKAFQDGTGTKTIEQLQADYTSINSVAGEKKKEIYTLAGGSVSGVERSRVGGDPALKIATKTDTPPPDAAGTGAATRNVNLRTDPVTTSSANDGDKASSGANNPNNSSNNPTFTPIGPTLPEFLERITSIFDGIIPFIIGLTVFFIIWKIVVYIIHAGEEEKRTEAKHFVLWGIIAIFCMLSIWGFVNILLNSFELDTIIDPDDIPTVPLIEAPTR